MDPEQHAPNTLSLAFSEDLYAAWRNDPGSVPANWRDYFASLSLGASVTPADAAQVGRRQQELVERQNKVDRLIRNYRVRGHNIARVNPLGPPPPPPEELTLAYYGFTEADLDLPFSAGSLAPGEILPLREILRRLQATYTRSIGAQFMHIDDITCRRWLYRRMESCENRIVVPHDDQVDILTRLTDAVLLEEFIQKKYIGAKSFSLEGAESLIPLLAQSIEYAGKLDVEDIFLGMAHRGRLNVMVNILGESPARIFALFEDKEPDLYLGQGDVKYHLGHHSDWTCRDGRQVHLALCFNPSHLEFVNAVALGRTRAKQDRLGDTEHERCMAILIHGDAAFIGEGIVQETLNLSELRGYRTGGTLHVVVNNQIGFTTDPRDARSSRYCTDVAKMLQIPVFHVNGEDPEAVTQVVTLALDYRRAFKRDVVIDMLCYRRRGHNEADEPAFTQPLLYEQIRRRKNVREGYLEHLVKLGEINVETADRIAAERRAVLEAHFDEIHNGTPHDADPGKRRVTSVAWREYAGGPEAVIPEASTRVARERLVHLLRRLAAVPAGFTPHRKIQRFLDQRLEMAEGRQPLDWSAAEALALATLAVEGYRVRLGGQDTERGTFSHRHAVLHDSVTGASHLPLQHLAPDQAPVEIYNSPLSEAGVVGFDYGYSLNAPDALVIWEAQFGDFVNAAQVIIDQFLASGESKWRFLSGLVLLLPHGFEGMGPEHSSARLERFLALAAEDNLQIAQPTTPAQLFHLLRRQVLRKWRKPLVVLTPKSMLRAAEVVSDLDELANGGFQRIIADPRRDESAGRAREILACTGKIYFELEHQRRRLGRGDVHIVRFEQLYPLPAAVLEAALAGYPRHLPVRWVQEEPENMGAWPHLRIRFGSQLLGTHPLSAVCRPVSASPATGSSASHRLESLLLLERVFGPDVRK
ncbi:MAG TPA: 2-oxoglutarate dehydrogenase E1 component [Candidatus Krumholzibacteria bacterium]|nr:2-oxoglutarate dehydrogenase E1 component [Candidatus Krumholzibacteria bacterium]HPD71844.1 2-oxoglutarate dehydrogenase E1 component [Candidatus Krumholzibacteria bacterium]HRY41223.1 2-oxoglutarate dehydrogenase E1 component [Candidatus Krumholzibacteria bacterium]